MLRKLRGGGAEERGQLHVAAFGKHPAWDDHIPDIGLETERLVEIKRVLYLDGIGGNVDAGTWDEREAAGENGGRPRPVFGHVFLWFDRDDWVMGRFWSSTDGKGRGRYPMVVCADCRDLSLAWFGPVVFERLARLQSECTARGSAPEVAAAVEGARAELRAKLRAHAGPFPAPRDAADPLAVLAACPEMGREREGLIRLLYHLEREMPELCRTSRRPSSRGGKTSWIDVGTAERAHHVRVPRCAADPMRALALWRNFLHVRIAGGIPRWIICPLDGDWAELLVGPPSPSALFCLRADREEIPLVSDVPYQMDAEVRIRLVLDIEGKGG